MTIANKATFKNKRKEAYPLLAQGIKAGATVANGAAVSIRNSAGANGVNGTAVVTGDVLTGVNMPATSARVTNGTAIPITGGTVAFTIAAGVITGGTFTPTP